MSDPRLGTTVGDRFRLNSRIGEGGMGAVFLADDSATKKQCAVKFLHRHLSENDEFVARFRQEAKAAGRFHHENAVRILDSGDDRDGVPWIAMEYCGGRSLKAILRDEGPLETGRACEIARQMLGALGAAHQSGIVHRDLKPENVKVESGPDGEIAKILDFGVAKFIGGEGQAKMTGAVKTKTGIVFGTPKYMAPEQIVGEKVDGRSDIYSVGTILYEMLTATPIFESTDIVGFVTKHMKEPVESLSARGFILPAGLEPVVLGMLEKDRKDRPEKADSVATSLEPYCRRPDHAPKKTTPEGRVRLLAFVVAAAAGAAAGAALLPAHRVAIVAAAVGLGLGAMISFFVWPRVGEAAFWMRTLVVAVCVGLAGGVAHVVLKADPHIVASLSTGSLLVFVGFAIGWGRRSAGLAFAGGIGAALVAAALVPLPVAAEGAEGGGVRYVPLWRMPEADLSTVAPALALAAVALAFSLLGLLGPKALTAVRR